MKIGVSILNSKDLKRDLELLNNTNCDYFHIDVMDNKFVTNKNDPYDILKYYENLYNKRLDVHLMCEKPLSYIDKYINLNTEFITFHVEIKEDIEKIIKHIKEYGIKVGLAIKPSTDIRFIEPFIDDIDLVLLMSVEPGYGGQKFLMSSETRIKELKDLIKDKNILISVDGGIDNITKKYVKEADILVSGSYILKGNYEERIDSLK
jgi:ribulose-phosphate 3-epimerase